MARMWYVAAVLVVSLLAVSCQTDPGSFVVDPELSQEQIFQRGQEAMGTGDYGKAQAYFEAGMARNGDDVVYVAEAEYNLCLIKVRIKDYAAAKEALMNFLDKYRPLAASGVGAQFVVLAEKLMVEVNAALKV